MLNWHWTRKGEAEGAEQGRELGSEEGNREMHISGFSSLGKEGAKEALTVGTVGAFETRIPKGAMEGVCKSIEEGAVEPLITDATEG